MSHFADMFLATLCTCLFSVATGEYVTLSWANAYQLCRRNRSVLPTDPSVNERLLHLLNGSGWDNVWIGIRERNLTTPTWIDGDPAANGLIEPNGHYSHTCVYMHARDRTLEYQNCYQPHIGFICEKHDCDRCPEGFSHYNCFTLGTSCVLVFCGIDSWFAARSACSIHEADLIMLKHKDDVVRLRRRFWSYNRSCKMYWVGLRSTDWVPTINMTHVASLGLRSPWLQGEPKEAGSCAVYTIQENGWKVVDCKEKHYVLCSNQITFGNEEAITQTPETTVEANETDIISGPTENRTNTASTAAVVGLSAVLGFTVLVFFICAYILYRKRTSKATDTDQNLQMVEKRRLMNIDDEMRNVEITIYGRPLPVDDKVIWEVDLRIFMQTGPTDESSSRGIDFMDLSSYTQLAKEVFDMSTVKFSKNQLHLKITPKDPGWNSGPLNQTVLFPDKSENLQYQCARFLLETESKDIKSFRADLRLLQPSCTPTQPSEEKYVDSSNIQMRDKGTRFNKPSEFGGSSGISEQVDEENTLLNGKHKDQSKVSTDSLEEDRTIVTVFIRLPLTTKYV